MHRHAVSQKPSGFAPAGIEHLSFFHNGTGRHVGNGIFIGKFFIERGFQNADFYLFHSITSAVGFFKHARTVLIGHFAGIGEE